MNYENFSKNAFVETSGKVHRKRLFIQRPNLKNLSGGLNLSGRSNMFGSTKNCITFLKIYAGAKLKPVFGGFKPRLKFIKFGHYIC